eukprot:CAMPEP_0119131176 /NCGR_PEP_ID=MMETSP1310-20130426/9652_1 /TAXON_ID=464262 /ORGANISM="Genus nov. species nov., Strain RCC2339" /LENGTH=232 /DNA_ID=CAMNT_0007121729 /DNA_START=59 /DNA_END=757 /DNA_ORIENTATION=+
MHTGCVVAVLALAVLGAPAAGQLAPAVDFATSWTSLSSGPGNGFLQCGDLVRISVTVIVDPGQSTPNSVVLTNRFDKYFSFKENSITVNLQDAVVTQSNDALFVVDFGTLPALFRSELVVTFDGIIEAEFDGAAFLFNNAVFLTIDQWPQFSDTNTPDIPIYYRCSTPSFFPLGSTNDDDDDLSAGEIVAIVLLPLIFILLLLLIVLAATRGGGSQRFTGAGPSKYQENPDG